MIRKDVFKFSNISEIKEKAYKIDYNPALVFATNIWLLFRIMDKLESKANIKKHRSNFSDLFLILDGYK